MRPILVVVGVVVVAGIAATWIAVRSTHGHDAYPGPRSPAAPAETPSSDPAARSMLSRLSTRVDLLAQGFRDLMDEERRRTDESVQHAVPDQRGEAREALVQPEEGSQPSDADLGPEAQDRDRTGWENLTAVERVTYMAETYDEFFDQEPPDPAWSRSTETQLVGSLRQADLGAPSVRWLECRSTLCRAGLSFRAVQDREAFFREAPASEPWSSMGEGFMRSESWEDTEVEVYVARRGHDLPDVPPPDRGHDGLSEPNE